MEADLPLCLNIEVVFDPAAAIEPIAIRIPFFLGVKTTVSRTEDIYFIYVHQRQPFLLVGQTTGRRKSCTRVARCQNRPPIIAFGGERFMIAFERVTVSVLLRNFALPHVHMPWTSTYGVVAVPTYYESSYVQLVVYFYCPSSFMYITIPLQRTQERSAVAKKYGQKYLRKTRPPLSELQRIPLRRQSP